MEARICCLRRIFQLSVHRSPYGQALTGCRAQRDASNGGRDAATMRPTSTQRSANGSIAIRVSPSISRPPPHRDSMPSKASSPNFPNDASSAALHRWRIRYFGSGAIVAAFCSQGPGFRTSPETKAIAGFASLLSSSCRREHGEGQMGFGFYPTISNNSRRFRNSAGRFFNPTCRFLSSHLPSAP